MNATAEGNAVVYCEGAFRSTYGKTAHGLVRMTRRYRILSVLDSTCGECDAGEVLDGRKNGIPVLPDLDSAIYHAQSLGTFATHMVIGLAPDGGTLDQTTKAAVIEAVRLGLNVDSGLHDFLLEYSDISTLALEKKVRLRDIRKTPPRNSLHSFCGKIEEVTSLKIAILGTDSAVGKRTTAWKLVDALDKQDISTEMIGTGQTAWLQGARFCIIVDSLINDYVAGEIEHVVWSAWESEHPKVIIIEGQGSLLNPAYPGGFEILAAGRPDLIILQHAPARHDYDGFDGYPIQPLETQIKALELISGKKVCAISINHQGIPQDKISSICNKITGDTGLLTFDALTDDLSEIVKTIRHYL